MAISKVLRPLAVNIERKQHDHMGDPKRLNVINKQNNGRIRFFSSHSYIQNAVSRGAQSFVPLKLLPLVRYPTQSLNLGYYEILTWNRLLGNGFKSWPFLRKQEKEELPKTLYKSNKFAFKLVNKILESESFLVYSLRQSWEIAYNQARKHLTLKKTLRKLLKARKKPRTPDVPASFMFQSPSVVCLLVLRS